MSSANGSSLMGNRFELGDVGKDAVVHLVGIGGAGMSAIATVLLQMGHSVEGTDIKSSANTERLRRQGAVVMIGHKADNVGDARLLVKSTAISEDNPELVEAERRGIRVISRAEMLSAVMDTKKGIAVAGTHGKTTTSSLLTQMMLGCGADPSYLIGGELNEIGGNAFYGSGDYLVAEADESDGSLLLLRPFASILTNVDSDHMDYYSDMEHTSRVFSEFLCLLPPGGFAVVCGDDPIAREVTRDYERGGGTVLFYGRDRESDYYFSDVTVTAEGSSFEAHHSGDVMGSVNLKVAGVHNVYNALASLAVGHRLGLAIDEAIGALGRFQGVRRRFERVGHRRGIEVIDDYAHHPTEIKAVLELAGRIAPSRVVAVFQPHRYTRTRLLAPLFGDCFTDADLVVITDVYGAGEDPEPGITGRLIADNVMRRDPERKLRYVPNRTDLAAGVVSMLEKGDMVITMGAGDVTQCAREIVDLLEDEGPQG